MDNVIKECIYSLDIKIPIVHIKDQVYQIGPKRVTMELMAKNDLVIKDGTKKERLTDFLVRTHKNMQRWFVIHMIQTDQTFEQVIENLTYDKVVPVVQRRDTFGGAASDEL